SGSVSDLGPTSANILARRHGVTRGRGVTSRRSAPPGLQPVVDQPNDRTDNCDDHQPSYARGKSAGCSPKRAQEDEVLARLVVILGVAEAQPAIAQHINHGGLDLRHLFRTEGLAALDQRRWDARLILPVLFEQFDATCVGHPAAAEW